MFFRKIAMALLALLVTGFAFATVAVLGQQADEETPGPGENAGAQRESAPHKAFLKKVRGTPPPAEKPAKAGREDREALPIAREAGRNDDPRSLKILAKLEEPVSMSFANETPLDDVLKYIKQATTTPTYSGIPIYVDPVGLQTAERSLNSTIQMDLEGVPLRRTLQLLLTQLGLVYYVEDGVLVITSPDSEDTHLPPSMMTPTPIMDRLEKAERGELSASEMKELLKVLMLRRQLKQTAASDEEPGAAPRLADEVKDLVKEIRELVKQLRAEMPTEAKKGAEAPAAKRSKGE